MLLPFWHGFTFNFNSPDKLTSSTFKFLCKCHILCHWTLFTFSTGLGIPFFSSLCAVHSSIVIRDTAGMEKLLFKHPIVSTADSVFMISAGLPSTKLCTTHSCGTIDSASAAGCCSTTLLRDLLLIWQELPACNLSLPNLFVTWGFFRNHGQHGVSKNAHKGEEDERVNL